MSSTELNNFIDALKAEGWIEAKPFRFQKRHWEINFDTSSWMELSTAKTPRIFDVPVPNHNGWDLTRWTLNLINHLFATNDKLECFSE